jgi:hypothetical protein
MEAAGQVVAWPPEKSVCLQRRLVPPRYLVTSGCSARAGVGMERATVPTTTMSGERPPLGERAGRLQIWSPAVVRRLDLLLRRRV